jgi:hypothetical protein
LEELLKLAFPPEEFGRVPRPPTPPAPPPPADQPSLGAEPPAEGVEPPAAVAAAAPQPHAVEPAAAQVMPTGNFPGGKPLVWLAQYLKARNKKNKKESAERNFDAALELAGQEAETLNEHYNNVFAAVKHLLWPCSAYIARRRIISREIPREPEPPKPEGGEDEEPPEDGEGGAKPPPPPPEYEEVPVLQYVATSHPMGADAIESWALEYETAGVTGRVMDGEPLLVPNVAAEPGLHWFARKPARMMGSYYALPLLDAEGEVWGVLTLDTTLDGRMLTGVETDQMQAIVQRANPVLRDVLAKNPTPEPESEDEAPQGGAEGGEGIEEGGD